MKIRIKVTNGSTHRAYDHYYDSPSYVYGYVTDGMQALIKTFTRQDHRAALRK